MSILHDDTDYSQLPKHPYESFEEQEQRREQEATAVNPPLTPEQQRIVNEQAGINPITQTVTDVIKDHRS